MSNIQLGNPGCGAVELNLGRQRILIDAFHGWADRPEVRAGDILLFTHDDQDHCDAEHLPALQDLDVQIIGPATVFSQIIKSGKARPDQIIVLHSPDTASPCSLQLDDISITCYHSPHFLGWDAVHNSYLITWQGQQIFITGDAYLNRENFPRLERPDLVICNLVDEGYIKQTAAPGYAVHHLLSYLLKMTTEFHPTRIYGVHLVGFDGTVPPEEMEQLVARYGFDHIIIPQKTDERCSIDL